MKRLLVLTTALLTCAIAPPASAGEYHVEACWSGGGPHIATNGSWVGSITDGYVAAYANCPAEGVVTRNTGGPERAPKWSGASQTFTAPPGTRITRLRGDIRVQTGQGWYAGLVDDDTQTWAWCGTNCSTFGTYAPDMNFWLNTSQIRANTVCISDSGCSRSAEHGAIAMRNVTVTINDPAPPDLAITGGSMAAGGWQRGPQTIDVAASDASGVQAIHLWLGVQSPAGSVINRNCDYSRVRPCADASGPIRIPQETFGSDGRHTATVTAVDAANNVSKLQRVLLIDNTPPGQALDAQLESEAWQSRNAFAITWRNPVQAAAPITAARYSLCRVGGALACVDGVSRGRDISAIRDLRVPEPGEWRVTVWLEDEAGNVDRERAVSAGVARFDDDVPSLSFVAQDGKDPTRVRVVATDDTSGIVRATIEARRQGEAAWRTLSTTLDSTGFAARLDDGQLPKGLYELRANAIDRAGNERSTQAQTNGDAAIRSLPLRVGTRLAVGRPARVRARDATGKWRTRTVLRVNPRARYGHTTLLRGRLTMPGANPLADADIEVWERVKTSTGAWRQVSLVRTSRTGNFRYKAIRGPSRTIQFRYPGTATIRSRTSEVELGVRATTSIRVSRARVVNGEEVRFSGRVKGVQPAATGKLLELQVFSRGRWSTFATPRAHKITGRWSLSYRFSATRGLVRYRFRVRIPREATFPYDTGTSRRLNVTVRGL